MLITAPGAMLVNDQTKISRVASDDELDSVRAQCVHLERA